MQTKENSFIKELISSIRDFEKYPEMAAKPFSTIFKYIVKLLLIFTIIVTAISVYDLSKDINEGIEYFKNEIPNLSFKDNKLKLETSDIIRIENSGLFSLIIINTNEINVEQKENYIDTVKNNYSSIVLLSEEVLINTDNGVFECSYEEVAKTYKIGDMTKQDILNYFTGTNLVMLYIGIFIMSFIYLFIAYLTSTLIDALLLGTIGYITALILKLRLKYVAMIKIAIRALTLSIILNLIYILSQALIGFEIKYFEVMYVAVAYIYIIATILMIKSDLIKRGQELVKIVEEEQRVREELKRKEEEEKEKQEQKKKEKNNKDREDKEKKNKKDSDKKEGLGVKPQGENA